MSSKHSQVLKVKILLGSIILNSVAFFSAALVNNSKCVWQNKINLHIGWWVAGNWQKAGKEETCGGWVF